MATGAQGDQQHRDHTPDEFGFESDVDLLLYSVVQHMREAQFDVADRDFILRSFIPSHAQQALVQRDRFTHPNDWMLAVKMGRNRDAYEEKQLVKAGFPARHPETHPNMHIKDQILHLNEKYPEADWVLLMDGLYDRLAARIIELPPDPEAMRRSSLYTAFVRALDDEWAVPQLDSDGEPGLTPDANAVLPADPAPREQEPERLPETITIEEIHLRLGIAESTVRYYLKIGQIPGGHQTGRKWIVHRATFEAWFRGNHVVDPDAKKPGTARKPTTSTGGYTPSF